MKTKKFHLGDILSVTTGRILPPRGLEGTADLLKFMTGESLVTHQLVRGIEECQPYLAKQFPKLTKTRMRNAIAKLDKMLEGARNKERKRIGMNWLDEQVRKYGKTLAVKPLPKGARKVRDPVEEFTEIFGKPPAAIIVT